MSRPTVRAALMALLGTLVAATAVVVAAPTGSAAAVPTRIMPLGDSITGSPGCWRALLWNRLQSTGYTNIDFVGTLPPQGCGVAHDGDNEGHGGFLATNVANQNQLPGWLSAHPARHRASCTSARTTCGATSHRRRSSTAFSKLVDQMRASNPAMKILVAKIIPMNPRSCTDVRPAGRRLQQRDPGLGRRQDHRAVADHRGRPVDRLQHGHRHLRRRAPQRRRRPEDVATAGTRR